MGPSLLRSHWWVYSATECYGADTGFYRMLQIRHRVVQSAMEQVQGGTIQLGYSGKTYDVVMIRCIYCTDVHYNLYTIHYYQLERHKETENVVQRSGGPVTITLMAWRS